MLLVQTLLNFLIGQTVVTMSIILFLEDLVGVTHQTAVLVLQFGDGFSNIFLSCFWIFYGNISFS